MTATAAADMLDMIISYEEGSLGPRATLRLYSSLIMTGAITGLQGAYGRTAADLIRAGLLNADGTITERGHKVSADLDPEN